jgi:hypothetical protein
MAVARQADDPEEIHVGKAGGLEAEVVGRELVVARRHAPTLADLVEEPFTKLRAR